jgi:glutamate-5-semialdehyde dehydrogenase
MQNSTSIATAIEDVAALPDPVGEVLAKWTRPNGLRLHKVRVPIGVIAIIYESRPNVTSDAAALCFKSGNATILRGGSEAIESNRAIVGSLQRGGERAGLPAYSIQFIDFPGHESVRSLGNDGRLHRSHHSSWRPCAHRARRTRSRVPVLKHYHGICHVYVHCAADFDMAAQIIPQRQVSKPGVCNAVETLLVDRGIAKYLYPKLAELLRVHGVEIRGDVEVLCNGLAPSPRPRRLAHWYLDLILSVKPSPALSKPSLILMAMARITTDAIVTNDKAVARTFSTKWTAPVVLWNASTRFNDGGEFGFGAEIGISTDKLHARGPMALVELCSYKYVVTGNGQVRG